MMTQEQYKWRVLAEQAAGEAVQACAVLGYPSVRVADIIYAAIVIAHSPAPASAEK